MSDVTKSLKELSNTGVSVESDTGSALRSIKLALSSSMVSGIDNLYTQINSLQQSSDRLIRRINQLLEETVDVISLEDASKLMDTIQTKQIQILDLYRKVIQTKELFPSDTLSEEEKQVLRLLKSFTTDEQKQKFFKIVQETLTSVETFE